MSDGFVVLNPGADGEIMDEELVGPFSSSPTQRLRTRVVVAGTGPTDIAPVINHTPSSTECGLVVRPIFDPDIPIPIGLPGDSVVEFGSITSIAANAITTIVSFIVPTGDTFSVVGFVGSGDVQGTYSLVVDSVTKMVVRSTPAMPNADISFKLAVPIATGGQSVLLRIEHFTSGITGDFEGTILGFLV